MARHIGGDLPRRTVSYGHALARLALGPSVRRIRREVQWHLRGIDFREVRETQPLAFLVAEHQTPLTRSLPGLDRTLQLNKVVNLRLAASRLDGVVLLPGRRLSFWREVGRPSRRRGFLEGMVLERGRIAAGVGGGLCQMTNLLYWMTLHTPLLVAERWRHSYDVFPDTQRAQPFGSGATCAWPMLDLQIENSTQVPYRLSVKLTDTHLVGSWSASRPQLQEYRIEERAHRITHEGPGVYVRHNELWRVQYDTAALATDEELVAENRALMMYQPFLPPILHVDVGS